MTCLALTVYVSSIQWFLIRPISHKLLSWLFILLAHQCDVCIGTHISCYGSFEMTPQKFSAGNVLLNAIALPFWSTVDKRWKKYRVSSGPMVTSEIGFPKSWTQSTILWSSLLLVLTWETESGGQVRIFRHFVLAAGSAAAHARVGCWVVLQMWRNTV